MHVPLRCTHTHTVRCAMLRVVVHALWKGLTSSCACDVSECESGAAYSVRRAFIKITLFTVLRTHFTILCLGVVIIAILQYLPFSIFLWSNNAERLALVSRLLTHRIGFLEQIITPIFSSFAPSLSLAPNYYSFLSGWNASSCRAHWLNE